MEMATVDVRKWDGQSINLAIIGARDRAISPVLLIAGAIGLGLWVLRKIRLPRPLATLAIVTIVLIGWVGLDARWQLDLLAKHRATVAEFGDGPIEERWRGALTPIYALAASVKRAFHEPAQRVFGFGDEAYSQGRGVPPAALRVHYDAVSAPCQRATYAPGDLIFQTWSRQVRYDKDAQQLS